MPQPETIGKYQVLQKIGEGGGGAVFQALDPLLKRQVAIKLCLVEDPDLARRFAREAEIAARLSHQNTVIVYDFGFVGDRPYLVQELLGGEDLIEIIHRRDPLSQKERLRCLTEIARALAFAHSEGVIHRDVKPSNIRILEDGRIKVLDFGIARLLDASTKLTRVGTTMGTAGYLAPEQIRGEEVDFRADVFSFGVLAYELLAYERPYEASNVVDLFRMVLEQEAAPIRTLYPEIPPAIDSWIAKCMRRKRRKRSERWESFETLLPEIEASAVDSEDASEDAPATLRWSALSEETWLLGSQPTHATETDPRPASSKLWRVGRWLVLLLLAVAGALGYWIWSLSRGALPEDLYDHGSFDPGDTRQSARSGLQIADVLERSSFAVAEWSEMLSTRHDADGVATADAGVTLGVDLDAVALGDFADRLAFRHRN